GAGQAPDHRQLCGAGPDRNRHGRRPGPGNGHENDSRPTHGQAGRGGGRSQLSALRGRRLHHSPGDFCQRWYVLMKRVVVTGMAGLSPIGLDWPTVAANLKAMKNGIRYIEEWDIYRGLNTRLGGAILDFQKPPHFHRRMLRSMGRVAVMATAASEQAL